MQDQFGALTAVEDTVLPSKPAQVLAIGSSMGGLVSAQEDQDSQGRIEGGFSDFIELGRASIDQADGGSANWNVGIDYESVLATSPFHKGVQALYQAAGLNLSADLQNLTKHANITPDPAAVSSLEQTSVPTGHRQTGRARGSRA